jgi:hypothetical protein
LKVLAVDNRQIDLIAATPSPTTFGENMQTLEIVSGQLQMPVVTSRPGISHMRLGSDKPQLHHFIPLFSPIAEPDSTPILDTNPVEPISFYPCIKHP